MLKKEVLKIDYDLERSDANRIQIKCSDDSTFDCDHLICTLPLGVLKKYHLNLFEPSLPQRKVNSIENMGFGTVNKIYVEFVQPFWDKNWEGISLLWQSDKFQEIRKEDPINAEWLKNVIGFYTVSFQPNILCGWISGDAARKMEKSSDVEFEAAVKRLLKIFLKQCKDSEIKNIIR